MNNKYSFLQIVFGALLLLSACSGGDADTTDTGDDAGRLDASAADTGLGNDAGASDASIVDGGGNDAGVLEDACSCYASELSTCHENGGSSITAACASLADYCTVLEGVFDATHACTRADAVGRCYSMGTGDTITATLRYSTGGLPQTPGSAMAMCGSGETWDATP